jgi:hypothetical protein
MKSQCIVSDSSASVKAFTVTHTRRDRRCFFRRGHMAASKAFELERVCFPLALRVQPQQWQGLCTTPFVR